MGVTLLSDRDWDSIDGKHCLVTEFTPMARLEDGEVKAISPSTPYVSVHLRCEGLPDEIVGFVTHKVDFATLWTAFNERVQVQGVRAEVAYAEGSRPGFCENSNLANHGGGPTEEVWLIWTKNRYKAGVGLLAAVMPKLIVKVCPKGAFETVLNPESRPELEGLQGEARADVFLRLAGPLATWTPDVMEE